MLSAIDDGVGLITSTLKKHNLTENTLIFFIGDNGAPLKIHKVDSPLNGNPGGWDGSLNDPLNGEKGMLAEGGIHVPLIMSGPGIAPATRVRSATFVTDVTPTILDFAQAPPAPAKTVSLDGRSLRPVVINNNRSFPSQHIWSDAVFVRHVQRLDGLSDAQCLKLAVLALVYGSPDLTHFSLAAFDHRRGTQLSVAFLQAFGA
jgi:arylsulfatase A-like enzyme